MQLLNTAFEGITLISSAGRAYRVLLLQRLSEFPVAIIVVQYLFLDRYRRMVGIPERRAALQAC